MKVQKVTVDELYALPGFQEMIDEYATLAIKKLPKPKFDRENYISLERLGILAVFAVVHRDQVVGFASCLTSRIPHYGIAIAIAESLFACERVRNLGVGVLLLATVERYARNVLGISALFVSCPVGSAFHKMLEYRNYSAETTTYVKAL